jgi:hypothetical protein
VEALPHALRPIEPGRLLLDVVPECLTEQCSILDGADAIVVHREPKRRHRAPADAQAPRLARDALEERRPRRRQVAVARIGACSRVEHGGAVPDGARDHVLADETARVARRRVHRIARAFWVTQCSFAVDGRRLLHLAARDDGPALGVVALDDGDGVGKIDDRADVVRDDGDAIPDAER